MRMCRFWILRLLLASLLTSIPWFLALLCHICVPHLIHGREAASLIDFMLCLLPYSVHFRNGTMIRLYRGMVHLLVYSSQNSPLTMRIPVRRFVRRWSFENDFHTRSGSSTVRSKPLTAKGSKHSVSGSANGPLRREVTGSGCRVPFLSRHHSSVGRCR